MSHGEVRIEAPREPWMVPLTGASAKTMETALRFIAYECDREKPDMVLIQRTIDRTLASTDHKLCCACGGSGVQS